jgi:hypothetical protein
MAGQFTEAYTRVSFVAATRFIHGLNRFYFRWIRAPRPAFGNILVFQKDDDLRMEGSR